MVALLPVLAAAQGRAPTSGGVAGIPVVSALGVCNVAADGKTTWLAPSNELRVCDGATWRKVYTDAAGVLPSPDAAIPAQRFTAQETTPGATAFAAIAPGVLWRIGPHPNATCKEAGGIPYCDYLSTLQIQANTFASLSGGSPNLLNSNGWTFNGTTPVKGVVHARVTYDFGAVAAGSCSEEAVTVTGAASSDRAYASADFALPVGLLVGNARAAANAVSVLLCNITGSSADPSSGTFSFLLVR